MPKKVANMIIGIVSAILVLMAAASPAEAHPSQASPVASQVVPQNVIPPGGGGGCQLTVYGTPGIISLTIHFVDTCGFSLQGYMYEYPAPETLQSTKTYYSNPSSATSGTVVVHFYIGTKVKWGVLYGGRNYQMSTYGCATPCTIV